ncbi:cyclopropane-fatty-acyl-phospholipid synthase family protein [Streptomyces sp. NPDC023838]|uniref:cyclopropane-fatty-acyl-phospholipid synthase family protein n=1 Tax=Streptomyces sp. NPDC023838 TaxID=3154325 RepID=UPI0033C6DCC9
MSAIRKGPVMSAHSSPGYAGASQEAIEHHYDLSNDFYALWLDPSLTYSCALWEPGDSLEQAQTRKIDYHITQARADSAERVLDIGCGWGSTLQRLIRTHGTDCAVGLTLSRQQAGLARARTWPYGDIRLENWVDHQPDEPYDSIICIGAFEHFARLQLSRIEKIAAYRAFLSRCHSWLRPGGRLSLQTISLEAIPDNPDLLLDLTFIARTIFPESQLPTLAEIHEAGAGTLSLVHTRADGADYARTCRCWLARLLTVRAEATAVVGEAMTLSYERYLRASARLFEHGCTQLLRLTFERTSPH